jgi:hypothetical protein
MLMEILRYSEMYNLCDKYKTKMLCILQFPSTPRVYKIILNVSHDGVRYTILDTVHCQVLSNTLETGCFHFLIRCNGKKKDHIELGQLEMTPANPNFGITFSSFRSND